MKDESLVDDEINQAIEDARSYVDELGDGSDPQALRLYACHLLMISGKIRRLDSISQDGLSASFGNDDGYGSTPFMAQYLALRPQFSVVIA